MAEENVVVGCHTLSSWTDAFQKGKDSHKLVVVDFTASWCGPCRLIAPYLAEVAKKKPDVVFLKVDVDELESVSREWEIDAMPTFLFFKDGKVIDKVVGAHKEDLYNKVVFLSSIDPPASASA